MPSSALDNALNSRAPSTFATASLTANTLLRKQQNRLAQGRGNQNIETGESAVSNIQKSHSIIYPPTTPAELPPLRPTIQPYQQPTPSPNVTLFPEENETMVVPTTPDAISKMGKPSQDGKKHYLTKTEWSKVLGAIKRMSKEMKDKEEDCDDLESKNNELEKSVKEYQDMVTQLSDRIDKLKNGKSGKKGSNSRKDEQKDDVLDGIRLYVKDVLFRTVKFALPGKQLKGACAKIWNDIKGNLKLDEGPAPLDLENFTEIYAPCVLTYLSERRSYHQTRVRNAAKEWWDEHGETLPEVELVEGIWTFPEAYEDGEKSERQQNFDYHMEVLTWWMDQFMPMAVGLECWGDSIRPFHLMTDKMKVEGDPSGRDKVLVTVTSEAFAVLLYANHRDRWLAEFQYKKGKKGKVTLPSFNKKDVSTHQYQNRWSSSQTGQKIGGGWAKEGLAYFNDWITKIGKFREEEEQRNFERYELAKGLIQARHQDKMEQEPTKSSKKRKNPPAAEDDDDETVVDLVFLDE